MKLNIYYVCTSSEGDDVAEETFQIDLNVNLNIEQNVDNQILFEKLNKFGWENESNVTTLVKEYIGEIPSQDDFHSKFFIVGIDDLNVDYSGEFFEFGDNYSMYFNL